MVVRCGNARPEERSMIVFFEVLQASIQRSVRIYWGGKQAANPKEIIQYADTLLEQTRQARLTVVTQSQRNRFDSSQRTCAMVATVGKSQGQEAHDDDISSQKPRYRSPSKN